MTARARSLIIASGLGLYLLGLGLVSGIAVERIRFDKQRTAVVRRYEEQAQQLKDFLMTIERAEATR